MLQAFETNKGNGHIIVKYFEAVRYVPDYTYKEGDSIPADGRLDENGHLWRFHKTHKIDSITVYEVDERSGQTVTFTISKNLLLDVADRIRSLTETFPITEAQYDEFLSNQ